MVVSKTWMVRSVLNPEAKIRDPSGVKVTTDGDSISSSALYGL